MKKLIIAAAIIGATGVTALSVAKSYETKPVMKIVKVDKGEFADKAFSAEKSDVANAD